MCYHSFRCVGSFYCFDRRILRRSICSTEKLSKTLCSVTLTPIATRPTCHDGTTSNNTLNRPEGFQNAASSGPTQGAEHGLWNPSQNSSKKNVPVLKRNRHSIPLGFPSITNSSREADLPALWPRQRGSAWLPARTCSSLQLDHELAAKCRLPDSTSPGSACAGGWAAAPAACCTVPPWLARVPRSCVTSQPSFTVIT